MIVSTIALLTFLRFGNAQVTAPILPFEAATVPVPTTNAMKHLNIATSKITIDSTEYNTRYIVLLRSGDVVKGVTFGQNFNENMEPLFRYPTDMKRNELPLGNEPMEEILVSNIPDFTSLLRAGSGSDTSHVMFAHFESPRPAITYRINVDFAENCELKVDSIEANDWSAWGGLWNPCSGKVTPWNTHLGSEEHEPDARLLTLSYDEFVDRYNNGVASARNILQFMRYYGFYTDIPNKSMSELNDKFNPYMFGHATEMGVKPDGTSSLTKWLTLGRLSIEVVEIMPDKKTFYLSDDGTNGMFLAFVADKEADLSSGTLYASRWEQLSNERGGRFNIDWIQLGKATQDELARMVGSLTFDRIFDTALPVGENCPSGFTSINTGHDGAKHECLAVKFGMEKAAAFFETRRYAAMRGATTELTVFEGLAAVPATGKLYGAISSVSLGMEDKHPEADFGGPNHIKLQKNGCGCVYEFNTKDNEGWIEVFSAEAKICGVETKEGCDVNSIAQPDNLAYMGAHGGGIHALLIAEDTSNHQNDYLWAYDLMTGELIRILTTVYGSQVTGPAYFTADGCGLLMAVVPHPYKKSDQDRFNDPLSIGLEGIVGYIGPIGTKV